MTTSQWRRTLYSRIALGFSIMIGLTLAIQGAGVVWLYKQTTVINGEEQRQVRLTLLRALANRLEQDRKLHPDSDIGQLLAAIPGTERFFIVLKEGRVVGAAVPHSMVETLTTDMRLLDDAEPNPPVSWQRSSYGSAFLKQDGKILGVIGVVPPTYFERFGSQIGAIGIGLLTITILGSAVLIVRPMRRRLQDLQHAARELGAGNLQARALEEGNDEIADLARAFNAMANELGEREKAVNTSDRLRRQLIADVSHELMTPLTSVLGHLETLTMEGLILTQPQQMHHARIAQREALRLKRLIGDLLDAARLEAGGIRLEIESIDVEAFLKEFAALHEAECRKRDIALAVTVAPDAKTVAGDPFRLEQAIANLVTNALRHTPSGGRVELGARRTESGVALWVADSGEGIPPEHLPFIFDRFYKASPRKDIASEGSGLGLSIVKAIATRHGGTVSATSVRGSGTTVTMEIPTPAELSLAV